VRSSVVVALALGACFASTATAGQPALERARYLMGTVCTIAVESADTTRAAAAIEDAFAEIDRLEGVMSSWRDDSELARLNAATAEGLACSADLWAVLDSALVAATETGGAFDPTIDPLNRVWDFRGAGRVPGLAEREAARSRVGWSRVERDSATRNVTLAAGTAVDLGGIGKGFALDRAARVLRAAGVDRALVDFGGEILALGAWEVAVADPRDRLAPALRFTVRDRAVSTSAQKERARTVDGQEYGHIFDPVTGAPVPFTGSVTVVGESPTRTDAVSTALLVMGRERARAWASKHPELGVLWIEPVKSKLHVWRWNLGALEVASDAPVAWK
jgi:FAD:protein FMN transferase